MKVLLMLLLLMLFSVTVQAEASCVIKTESVSHGSVKVYISTYCVSNMLALITSNSEVIVVTDLEVGCNCHDGSH